MVLTAAHCLDGAYFVNVYLGAHDINAGDAEVTFSYLFTFDIHEGWNVDTLQNDIGYIQLPSKVPLSMQNSTLYTMVK